MLTHSAPHIRVHTHHTHTHTHTHTSLLSDLVIMGVNDGVPASERTHRYTLERDVQTDTYCTHTNTGRPIDLLSSPPVVCSGFWLSPGSPFKGSAVV